MIGKQIRSVTTHTLGQAQISSSGQRRHVVAACVSGEVIAKSRRRSGTTVETEHGHLTWLGADLVSSQTSGTMLRKDEISAKNLGNTKWRNR